MFPLWLLWSTAYIPWWSKVSRGFWPEINLKLLYWFLQNSPFKMVTIWSTVTQQRLTRFSSTPYTFMWSKRWPWNQILLLLRWLTVSISTTGHPSQVSSDLRAYHHAYMLDGDREKVRCAQQPPVCLSRYGLSQPQVIHHSNMWRGWRAVSDCSFIRLISSQWNTWSVSWPRPVYPGFTCIKCSYTFQVSGTSIMNLEVLVIMDDAVLS